MKTINFFFIIIILLGCDQRSDNLNRLSDLIKPQYSKQQSIEFGLADSLTLSTETVLLDPEKLFIPGMGSPNTFISTNALSITAQKLFSDLGLELRYTSMFDLDKKGSLHGVGLEYEIFKNTNLLIEVTKIFNNDEIQMNPFTAMKDFSRILFEIRYFY